jgi:hypothetical protein
MVRLRGGIDALRLAGVLDRMSIWALDSAEPTYRSMRHLSCLIRVEELSPELLAAAAPLTECYYQTLPVRQLPTLPPL